MFSIEEVLLLHGRCLFERGELFNNYGQWLNFSMAVVFDLVISELSGLV